MKLINPMIQQCLCGITIVSAAGKVDLSKSEFGRDTSVFEDFSDAEEFIVTIPFLSMSMSFDYTSAPTPPPTIQVTSPSTPASVAPQVVTIPPVAIPQLTTPPTAVVLSTSILGCEEQVQTNVGFKVEVDTAAIGKDDFSDDLIQAFHDALSAEYSFCSTNPQSGVTRNSEVEDFFLGEITTMTAKSEEESCLPQSSEADACHVVDVAFLVSGDDSGTAPNKIGASLESILDNDKAFSDGLYKKGIVAVRMWSSDGRVDPNQAVDPGTRSASPNPAVLTALSVAALTIAVAALALRKSGWGLRQLNEKNNAEESSKNETLTVTLAGTTTA